MELLQVTTSFTTIGSIPWMAPEVIQQQDGYGRKASRGPFRLWSTPRGGFFLVGVGSNFFLGGGNRN